LQVLQILVLDDEISITNKLFNLLSQKKYAVLCANRVTDAFQLLKNKKVDIVLLDVVLPQSNGIEILKSIKSNYPDIEVIMMSGFNDIDMVIEAMHGGAVDFIKKPFSITDIQLAIQRTGKYMELQQRLKIAEDKNSLISQELETRIEKNFIGVSEYIKSALELSLIAGQDNDVNVLITGENGTGKEIIARIIHHASNRKNDPFSPINCSAIPETLLESEFFGHKKGAFTDAKENKRGVFELANGGSLFLDEIADMPLSLQAKLLRAIEEKRVKQIGSDKEIYVDIRIISATNKNLDLLIKEGKFRLDLYHRINTLTINIPPLRDRPDDIEPLFFYFLKDFTIKKNRSLPKVSRKLINQLKQYSFPGNVRELKNMVERALILSKDNKLVIEDFTINFINTQQEKPKKQDLNLRTNEIYLIEQALKKVNLNQNKAAKLLGISRDALIRRMKKFQIKINKNLN
jgi:DNA-binding NtrC family response regulator